MILLCCLKVDIYICILPTDILVRYGNPDKITQVGILYYRGSSTYANFVSMADRVT